MKEKDKKEEEIEVKKVDKTEELVNKFFEEDKESQIPKKESKLFNIFGILAIVILIVSIIFIAKIFNSNNETETQLNEKWVFKNDNNKNGMMDIGDEICISTECFYIIGNDGENLKALSKYNLEIGYNCIYKEDDYVCEKIENETNIQSEKAIGYNEKTYNTTGNYGVIAFSKNIYWKNYDEYTENDFIIELDVSSNLINDYLKIYKKKLELLGSKIEEVTLITRDELRSLGCPEILGVCEETYDWLYQTSYWSRSSRSLGNVWKIQSNNYFSSNDYDYANFNGVRPVIIINLNEFK